MKIPPPPSVVTKMTPFDRAPSEAARESIPVGIEDDMHGERTDPWFYQNLARTSRFGN